MAHSLGHRTSRLSLGSLLAGLLLTAASAHAVDGVVLIDQDCALMGCFAGDTAGFPVTITDPGSYRLASNLTVDDPVGSGIVVTTNPYGTVTLDLNGFSIRGGYSCGVSPPDCAIRGGFGVDGGAASLEVRNGLITRFGLDGIRTLQRLVAEDVTVHYVGGNGIKGGYARVRDVMVQSTRLDGIRIFGGLVLDSFVTSARGDGIELESSGIVRGVGTNNIWGEGVRLGSTESGYAESQLAHGATGGHDLGQNLCDSAVCP